MSPWKPFRPFRREVIERRFAGQAAAFKLSYVFGNVRLEGSTTSQEIVVVVSGKQAQISSLKVSTRPDAFAIKGDCQSRYFAFLSIIGKSWLWAGGKLRGPADKLTIVVTAPVGTQVRIHKVYGLVNDQEDIAHNFTIGSDMS